MSLYDIFPVKELSGNIVTFSDGADGIPIESLSADIEYIQDLHGYANPWPAGGGKNLVDPAKKAIPSGSTTTARWYKDGTGFLLHGGQAYALSSNISTDATYFVYIYDIGGTQLAYGKWATTYTPSADTYVYFQFYESGGAHLADAELQLELGSTATSFAPYANICPISGLTGLSVYRTGKNILKLPSYAEMMAAPMVESYHSIAISCKPSTQYYLSTEYLNGYTSVGQGFYLLVADSTSNNRWKSIAHSSSGIVNGTLTSTADGLLYLNCTDTTESKYNDLLANVQTQLAEGSTSSPYEPYNGNTYSVDWTTQVGTVCQGTVEPVAGILNVDKVGVDLGSLSWTKYGSTANYDRYITSGIDSLAKSSSSVVCSIYKARVGSETITANMIWIESGNSKLSVTTNVGAFANATDFKNGMSGQILVFEISDQQPIQLTPMQISTLLGENNVWANVAPITVRYHSQMQTEGKQIDSLFVDGVDMQADGWFLKWRKLAAPKPKTDYISVWGRDGDIDLTESETGGQVFYENRELTMDMVYIGEDWTDAYSELLDNLHGKDCIVQFLNDPYWYWAGRIVASLYEHKPRSLSMSGIMFPYKLSILKVEKSATVSGVTESNAVEVVLPGSRMRVSPKVTVTAGSGDSVTLKWGNKTQALSAGTYYVRGLKVGSEDVTIKVYGTGKVDFEYRKGML